MALFLKRCKVSKSFGVAKIHGKFCGILWLESLFFGITDSNLFKNSLNLQIGKII